MSTNLIENSLTFFYKYSFITTNIQLLILLSEQINDAVLCKNPQKNLKNLLQKFFTVSANYKVNMCILIT